ncbi:MAG: dTDP-glucose 4,6-dehydratase [Phycisphaerae bacterium]|nr:dTDP-glucose 4,6-dehydratase [Phycisphaerae bacterium]
MKPPSFSPQRLLVTGGAGFIGSNFVRYVLDQHADAHVINLDKLTYAGNLENLAEYADHPRHTFVRGDIGDYDVVSRLLREHEIDSIVHFAAESHVDRSIVGPAVFVQTNVAGTLTLLHAARNYVAEAFPDAQAAETRPAAACGRTAAEVSTPARTAERHGAHFRFLNVGTDEVYGSLGESGFFTEDTPLDPHSPYSASKAAADHLVSAYLHTFGLPTIVTRCSNNYGPYQFPEKMIPLMINNARRDKPLPVYGDGLNVRDWLYVLDHCTALWAVLTRGRIGRVYNIGGNNEKTNLEVVGAILSILGKPESLITYVKDRPGHDRRYAIDAARIMRELGWTPSVTFEQGLRRTIEWYLANQAWLDRVVSGDYQKYYEAMYANR